MLYAFHATQQRSTISFPAYRPDQKGLTANPAAPKAATAVAASIASKARLEGVLILSGEVASFSGGTDGSPANHDR